MSVRGWLRDRWVEVLWGVFALTNLGMMLVWPEWLRLPFFLVWISLTLVYGFRLWSVATTVIVLALLSSAVVGVVLAVGLSHDELWGKLVAVPFLAAMFIVMAWHAHRRAAAQQEALALAETRASLVAQQQQFVDDASHELRTPVTIARGHLELLSREQPGSPAVEVALDELDRMERIIDRLLLLAASTQPKFLVFREVEIDDLVEDVFMRWSEVAERSWRLEVDIAGKVQLDPDALRSALDALLENAVKHTETRGSITLRAYPVGGEVVIEVADEGCGIPAEALDKIFARFARTDTARRRADGGVGLGLAIVDAIVTAHGGRCTVVPQERGVTFALRLPFHDHLASEPATKDSDAAAADASGPRRTQMTALRDSSG